MATVRMTFKAFQEAEGFEAIDIIKNPQEDGKWFAAADNGKNYKVSQKEDWADKNKRPKTLVVLVEDGILDEACFIGANSGTTPVATYR